MSLSKVSWLNVAYGLAVFILFGMSLPWTDSLALRLTVSGGLDIARNTYRGWNLVWLILPALAAVASYVFAFRKNEEKKWLWVALISSALSLIIMVFFGMRFTDTPLIGFWLTLLGFIAVIVITARSLFWNKAQPQEPA